MAIGSRLVELLTGLFLMNFSAIAFTHRLRFLIVWSLYKLFIDAIRFKSWGGKVFVIMNYMLHYRVISLLSNEDSLLMNSDGLGDVDGQTEHT